MSAAKECRDRDITISPRKFPVSVMFNGHEIATSVHALDLKEGAYPTVIYLPLGDVDPAVLRKSDHNTKGSNP